MRNSARVASCQNCCSLADGHARALSNPGDLPAPRAHRSRGFNSPPQASRYDRSPTSAPHIVSYATVWKLVIRRYRQLSLQPGFNGHGSFTPQPHGYWLAENGLRIKAHPRCTARSGYHPAQPLRKPAQHPPACFHSTQNTCVRLCMQDHAIGADEFELRHPVGWNLPACIPPGSF